MPQISISRQIKKIGKNQLQTRFNLQRKDQIHDYELDTIWYYTVSVLKAPINLGILSPMHSLLSPILDESRL